MNYAELTNRELDALVAEVVMGWSRRPAYESADTAKPFPWFAADDDPDSIEFDVVGLRQEESSDGNV